MTSSTLEDPTLRCKKANADTVLPDTHVPRRRAVAVSSRMSENEVQLKFLSNIIQRQDVAFVTGITRRSRHKKRVRYLQVGPHGGNQ